MAENKHRSRLGQNAGAIMKIYKSGNIDFQVFGQV